MIQGRRATKRRGRIHLEIKWDLLEVKGVNMRHGHQLSLKEDSRLVVMEDDPDPKITTQILCFTLMLHHLKSCSHITPNTSAETYPKRQDM